MSPVVFEIEMPAGWESFRLPSGVNRRLQELLDRQDAGQTLLPTEREEAEGLVELAEWLSLMRLRASHCREGCVTRMSAVSTPHDPMTDDSLDEFYKGEVFPCEG